MKSPDKLIQIGFVQSVVDFFIACISLGFLQELKVVVERNRAAGVSRKMDTTLDGFVGPSVHLIGSRLESRGAKLSMCCPSTP